MIYTRESPVDQNNFITGTWEKKITRVHQKKHGPALPKFPGRYQAPRWVQLPAGDTDGAKASHLSTHLLRFKRHQSPIRYLRSIVKVSTGNAFVRISATFSSLLTLCKLTILSCTALCTKWTKINVFGSITSAHRSLTPRDTRPIIFPNFSSKFLRETKVCQKSSYVNHLLHQ
jgi:hypothetical protein